MILKKLLTVLLLFLLSPAIFVNNIFAQSDDPLTSPLVSGAPRGPTPTGQLLSLELTFPGIGNTTGNLSPIHTTRDVTIYFFSPDVNTQDLSVRPVASLKSTIEYDPDSGKFKNLTIDLSDSVTDGQYQIVVKTPQALSNLIKEDPKETGGTLFQIRNSYSRSVEIKNQEVVIGDIHPVPLGDNVMDINDFNMLVACFGEKAEGETCVDKNSADLDDDGKIGGTDYNLMFESFNKLRSQGKPVPSFISTPVPTKSQVKTSPEPTADNKQSDVKSSSTSIIPIVIVIVILLIAGAASFFFRKKIRQTYSSLLHKKQEPNIKEEVFAGEGADEIVDKDFYVKKQTVDEANQTIVLTLTDDSGPMLGYYKGKEVTDGFYHIKGAMKKEGDKVYIEVLEITPVKESS